ncbi:Rep protein [Gigaspora margarita]|uniref:Rep protein n=1 Tax=Gigaspora margarita TaxID=4874 RepID=A0A8H4A4G2_GIGMA|nr:Rep protein [Gigaspora margarita]
MGHQKQVTNKQKNIFEKNSAQFFLTYSHCLITKEELLKCLETIIEDITISNYIVANELHNDEDFHKHVYLKLRKQIHIHNERFFDININNTINYSNITDVCSTNFVIDYMTKYGDFISKYKLEKLKVVELYILNRVKKGEYIKIVY